jgi:glycosyltransferase involved in cell wall biosynthesis
MKILLVGNYPPDRQQSMLRFAELMQRELTARGHEVMLLQPQRVLGTAEKTLGPRKWLAYLDKFLLFPRTLRKAARAHDITHICDHSNAMYTRNLRGLPHLVTCHDVLAIKSALGEIPQNTVSGTGRRLQAWILAGLKAARYIVCDSEISRQDMLRVTGRPPATSELIYLSLNYNYSPMQPEEALTRLDALGFDARKPYFMHVGGGMDFWYKNRPGILRIYKRLYELLPDMAPQFLFIGGELEPETLAYLESVGLRDKAFYLGGISNEDLRAAYSLSEGLIYPSLQEGFGWPVLEAQACGCAVFASNRAPMTELGADAAVYFDPEDTDAAAGIVVESLGKRPQMREGGLRNVKRFTVDKMIDQYVAAYAKVAGGLKQ